jgi:hypothetical protein
MITATVAAIAGLVIAAAIGNGIHEAAKPAPATEMEV